MKTHEEWLRLVRSHTVSASPEDAEEIARRLVTAGTSSVWHEHARFYGTKCWCAQCARPGSIARYKK